MQVSQYNPPRHTHTGWLRISLLQRHSEPLRDHEGNRLPQESICLYNTMSTLSCVHWPLVLLKKCAQCVQDAFCVGVCHLVEHKHYLNHFNIPVIHNYIYCDLIGFPKSYYCYISVGRTAIVVLFPDLYPNAIFKNLITILY